MSSQRPQQNHSESETTAERLRKILERIDDLPILDNRGIDEILEYDKNGLPR